MRKLPRYHWTFGLSKTRSVGNKRYITPVFGLFHSGPRDAVGLAVANGTAVGTYLNHIQANDFEGIVEYARLFLAGVIIASDNDVTSDRFIRALRLLVRDAEEKEPSIRGMERITKEEFLKEVDNNN